MAACKLIVNADDFGLSTAVNRGILKAHQTGILTSTSIIANGAAFEDAIKICKSVPTLDIGVHLTLVEEKPIIEAARISSLLNKQGRFYDHITTFLKQYLIGRISLADVKRELDAQIGKIVDHGLIISHLDGHQHVHMLPGIRHIVGELANRYGITAIRYPKEHIKPYMFRKRIDLTRVSQLAVLNAFCTIAKTTDTARTEHFVGFFMGGRLTKENLRRIITNLPNSNSVELMCHPGVFDSDCRYSHWGYMWEEELKALTDTKIIEILCSRGVQLISYRELTC